MNESMPRLKQVTGMQLQMQTGALTVYSMTLRSDILVHEVSLRKIQFSLCF